MDWALAIERNRATLMRIVAGLMAMAGLGGGAATLPRSLRNAVYRLLRPAESAARRLIVIAARGMAPLVGECAAEPGGNKNRPHPLPLPRKRGRGVRRRSRLPSHAEGGGGAGGGGIEQTAPPRIPAFALFDPPKRFAWLRPKTVPGFGPRISTPGVCDPVFIAVVPPGPGDPVPATRLFRRLAALRAALADIPRQARRLARRQALRAGPRPSTRAFGAAQDEGREPAPGVALRPHPEPPGVALRPHPEPPGVALRPHPEPPRSGVSKGEAAVRSPLRPGAPPGRRRRPTHEVDAVLAECHALALDALDTS